MGSATACHLAARGASVLGIDQFDPPHDMGSSHGESRIIRTLYYEHPLYVPLVQRSFELWRRLERDTSQAGLLHLTGGLMLGGEDSDLIRGVRRSAREHDLPLEDLSSAEMQKRFPQFSLPAGIGAVLDPEAGYLDPERCIAAHLAMAARHGAALQTGERVQGWTRLGDGVRVTTSLGTYDAGALVLSAGAWIGDLVGESGPPFTIERQTLVWYDPPGDPAAWAADRFPIYMCEFADGQLVYGFPLLGRGWKAAVHHQGELQTDAAHLRRTVQPHDVSFARAAVARLFPWVADADVLHAAPCYYTDTSDYMFTIDFLPGVPNVLVSSPCSGHGFKFASAIGELQAQLLLDGRSEFDITPFRIGR